MRTEVHPRRTILVLRALGLGDLLTGLPALRGLRAAYRADDVVLAAPAWLAPLALHARAVHRVLPTDPLAPIALSRPGLAVNLHGRGPQSHRRLLETSPTRLLAFEHPQVPESAGLPAWRPGEHEVHRWCRLLNEGGMPCDPSRLHLEPAGLPVPEGACGATIIHPGAKCGARRWPAERWAAVARHERRRGRLVLVTAGPGEVGLAARVAGAAGLGPASIRAGGDLLHLAGLVAAAGRILSADTGVAHLATALRRPSVIVFGPVSPAEWGPPPGPLHRALWAGRRGDPSAQRPGSGLLEIWPEDVIQAVEALPGPPDGTPAGAGAAR